MYKFRLPSKRRAKKALVLLSFLFPALVYYVIFHYIPMYGTLIAFKDYNPFLSFSASPWVGLKHFKTFFSSLNASRLIKNTFLLSFWNIVFSFPLPILFAIFLNEVKNTKFRTVIQSISYFPHFISTVILCGLLKNFLSPNTGIVNAIIVALNGTPIDFMHSSSWFRTIYISSGIWQSMGWNSIIFYATLTSLDTSLFEAAEIDGASRFRRIWHISLPSLLPTMVTLLLLNLGNMMNVGFEKVLLLHNPSTYEVSDIISTYVYRAGLINLDYSFAAAVNLFNSVIGITLILLFNFLSKRFVKTSLW